MIQCYYCFQSFFLRVWYSKNVPDFAVSSALTVRDSPNLIYRACEPWNTVQQRSRVSFSWRKRFWSLFVEQSLRTTETQQPCKHNRMCSRTITSRIEQCLPWANHVFTVSCLLHYCSTVLLRALVLVFVCGKRKWSYAVPCRNRKTGFVCENTQHSVTWKSVHSTTTQRVQQVLWPRKRCPAAQEFW